MKPNKVRSELNNILYGTEVVLAGTGLGREESKFGVRFTDVTPKKKVVRSQLGTLSNISQIKASFENS